MTQPAVPPAVLGTRRPDRRIAVLLAIALTTTGLLVGFVWLTKPPGPTIARGLPVPEFSGGTLDNSTLDLAALRGRPVLINFWGPTCAPCREEMPLLADKAREHAADGLVIVGVLTDDPVDGAKAFADQYGGTWQTVIDPGAKIKAAYHVVGRPQSFFVDRTGVLRSIQLGPLTDADFERQFAQIAGGS